MRYDTPEQRSTGAVRAPGLQFEPEEVDQLDEEFEEKEFGSRINYLRFIVRNQSSIEPNTTERLDDPRNG